MSVKLEVLRESIARCKKLIDEKEKFLNENWLGKVCRVNIEAQKLFKNTQKDERLNKEFCDKISALAKQEEFYLQKAKEYNELDKEALMDEIVEINAELRELTLQLFIEEQKIKNGRI